MKLNEEEAKVILSILDEKIVNTKNELLLKILNQVKEKIKNIICYGTII